MASPRELTMKVTATWAEIIRVNEAVDHFMSRHGVPVDEAQRYTMVACELVENAIKYGYFPRGNENVLLYVKLGDSYVLVQVTNPVSERSNSYLRELDRIIQWARGFQDPFEAYVERVRAISGEPLSMSKSCLGIARIAYEGRAALDFYLDEDGTLSVSAVTSVA